MRSLGRWRRDERGALVDDEILRDWKNLMMHFH
jgi:hypothetical protein